MNLDPLDEGGPGPECPTCGSGMLAVGREALLHWWCPTCRALRPSDGIDDRRERVRVGDLIAARSAPLRFAVSIGGVAPLGELHRGVGAWVATFRPDRFGRLGTLYEARGLPEVLGVADSVDGALALYPPAAASGPAPPGGGSSA